MNEEEKKDEQNVQAQPQGVIQTTIYYFANNPISNMIKYFIGSIWSGLVWLKHSLFLQEVHENTSGEEFKNDFRDKIGRHNFNNDIKIRFFGNRFLELCQRSRRSRKPILIIMLRDDSEETYEYVANALSSETV